MPFHPAVEEWDSDLVAGDPLGFPGYETSTLPPGDSVRTGRTAHYAFIESLFDVHGGTLGAAAGEKVVRAYRRAVDRRLPMVLFTRSGGARVQEGMVALAQLPRVVGAARRHAEAGLLSVAVYGSPTTGGVLASYGSSVDVRAAHPAATIGFAGPRVAEATLGIRLPVGSHTARSLYEAGLLDALIPPGQEAGWVDAVLGRRDQQPPSRPLPVAEAPQAAGAWGEVLRARAVGRPTGFDWVGRICSSWSELRGADPTVRAGLATIAGRRCLVVATDRYEAEGRPTPSGFRLAVRVVRLAGRLGLPVVTLVDTPGADPSPASETDGLALELAATFEAFAACPTPIVSVCVGEGGSGGALALSFADRLLMCEHAVFSVISPEGAAAILERDSSRAPEVAGRLLLTSHDVVGLGVADAVVPEDPAGLEAAVAAAVDDAVAGDRERRLDAATGRWVQG